MHLASPSSSSLLLLLLHTYITLTLSQLTAPAPEPVEETSFTPKQSANARPVALVLTHNIGYEHDSQPHAIRFLNYHANLRNWTLVFQPDLSFYVEHPAVLQRFNVIIFLLTLGPIFDEPQQKLFLHYVTSGGGVVGVHSAIDTNKHWPFFFTLVGASFVGHPPVQTVLMNTTDYLHPTTSFLPKLWATIDEMYNFVEPEGAANDKHVILAVNESSYEGGQLGDWHPVSWVRYHYPARSRIWVTTLGHPAEAYEYSQSAFQYFQRHLVLGIEWAANGTERARTRWKNIVEDFQT